MTECTGQEVLFSIGKKKVTTVFDGGKLTSDSGVLFLNRVDERLGLSGRMAGALLDPRQEGKVLHSLRDLLRQRLFQIALGYEDVNDANSLRFDPAFQAALDRVPGPGEVLASQPTLSRLEERISRRELMAFSGLLVEFFVERLKRMRRAARRKIILDFDSTADPTHGAQQLTMFHGYYDQWQYLPLLVFSGGWPIAAVLRPGNAHDSWGAVAVLRRIVERIWEEFPKAEIQLRADAGFAVPELYEFCEAAGISYLIGQITNSRLVRRARPWMKKAKRISQKTGEKAKVFGSFKHRAKSWEKSRRIIAKAEVLPLGENPRFVATNMEGDPASLYDFYTDRGEMENRIKDLKNALSADRLSCSRFLSNQFRLLLHVAAYILMFCLRENLQKTPLASAQMDTLRLKLLKIGAKVVTSARRVWFHLASAHPAAPIWNLLAQRLARAPA
ncbi:MAG: IS1380 family transposase [Candidatus Binatia bacterium]